MGILASSRNVFRNEALAFFFSVFILYSNVAESGLLPNLNPDYDVGKWNIEIVLEPNSPVAHIVETGIVERQNAERRMYRDLPFACGIRDFMVFVNMYPVSHTTETLDWSGEEGPFVRLGFIAFADSMVDADSLVVQISYTADDAVHTLRDGAHVFVAASAPPCTFFFCPTVKTVVLALQAPGADVQAAGFYASPGSGEL
eukprot:CAMPEP_0113663628 /NCGR_PEP_ID=MMETSP0038_2-20120614/1263_1 /TAXON_ID=2898 /ORGANISM="Cryptomonas paramecium" /LENGTH=199 /DNA_ID=CAMNT_0000578707 /DNA_START=113 /DNA_END=709 /DNA_ORIENTATION=- /assembly_acc=CAM_ASM_000170